MRLLARCTIFALVSSLLLLPVATRAIWVAMDLRQTVTTSDEIVVATLQDVRSRHENDYDLGEGDLVVERVVWGTSKPGETLVLRWRNRAGIVCPRVEHTGSQAQRQLWFLTRNADGSVQADHPDRVMPVEELETVMDTLAVYPYRVIAPNCDAGQRATITIEFRNATSRALTVPGFDRENGELAYGDGFKFTPGFRNSQGQGIALALKPDAPFRYDASLASQTLGPGDSFRVELPFSDMVGALEPGYVRFGVQLSGMKVEYGFSVRSVWQARLERVIDTSNEVPFYLQTIRAKAPEASAALSMLRLKPQAVASVVDELMALSDSLETNTRCEIMMLVSHVDSEPERRVDFFLDRVDDPDRRVRDTAFGSACNVVAFRNLEYRREEIVARLMAQLDDEDPLVRQSAASSLSSLRAVMAVPSLQRLVSHDGVEQVRRSAQYAIDTIEGRNCCKCRETAKVIP